MLIGTRQPDKFSSTVESANLNDMDYNVCSTEIQFF